LYDLEDARVEGGDSSLQPPSTLLDPYRRWEVFKREVVIIDWLVVERESYPWYIASRNPSSTHHKSRPLIDNMSFTRVDESHILF